MFSLPSAQFLRELASCFCSPFDFFSFTLEFTALFVCQFAFLRNFAQQTYTLQISWFALKNKLPSTDFNKWFSVSCVLGQSPAQVSQMRKTNNGIKPKQGNEPARKPGPCQSGYFVS